MILVFHETKHHQMEARPENNEELEENLKKTITEVSTQTLQPEIVMKLILIQAECTPPT